MASFQYDPGVTSRSDVYTSQAGQALANDVTNMFAQHHANKLQDQLDQANAAKAKVTMDFLARQQNPTNPQEMGASLEDITAFHDALAKGNPTKATKIAEGAAANFATSVALQHQAAMNNPQLRYVAPQGPGVPQGMPGRLVLTGQGKDVTPFQGSTGVIPGQTSNGVQVPPIPFVQTSQGQIQPLIQKPTVTPKDETLPNGQIRHTDAAGRISYSTASKTGGASDTWEKYAQDLKAASGGNPFEWANGTNYTMNKDGSVQSTIPGQNNNSLTLKLSKSQREEFDNRYRSLSGSPPAGGVATTTSASRVDVYDKDGTYAGTVPNTPAQIALAAKQGLTPK